MRLPVPPQAVAATNRRKQRTTAVHLVTRQPYSRLLEPAPRELVGVGDLHVPHEPEPFGAADYPPRHVELALVESVPRRCGEGVMVVVPALAEDERRDEPVVPRFVARAVVLAPEHVADRVHGERRVLVREDPDQAAPDEPLEPGCDRSADQVAEQERQPKREDHPEEIGPVDPADELVLVEIFPVLAALLHAEV